MKRDHINIGQVGIYIGLRVWNLRIAGVIPDHPAAGEVGPRPLADPGIPSYLRTIQIAPAPHSDPVLPLLPSRQRFIFRHDDHKPAKAEWLKHCTLGFLYTKTPL